MMTTDLIYELCLLIDLMNTKVDDEYWLYLLVVTAEWYYDHLYITGVLNLFTDLVKPKLKYIICSRSFVQNDS